jgi:RimJ/RimL family protein N-acetyltransferase
MILTLMGDTDRFHLWGHRRVCDEEQLVETWRFWSTERMGAKFTVTRNGKPIGLVFDYERSLEDGHTKIATMLVDGQNGRGAGVIATTLFALWLFQTLPLRKVYMDVFEFNESVVQMLKKLGMHLEMQRAQHRFWNGRYWDQYSFGFYRDDLPGLTKRVFHGRQLSRRKTGDVQPQGLAKLRNNSRAPSAEPATTVKAHDEVLAHVFG